MIKEKLIVIAYGERPLTDPSGWEIIAPPYFDAETMELPEPIIGEQIVAGREIEKNVVGPVKGCYGSAE